METNKRSQEKNQPHQTTIQSRALAIPLPRNASPEEQLALQTLSRLNGALEKLGLPAIAPPDERKSLRRSSQPRFTRKPARHLAQTSRQAHEAHCTICCHELCDDIEQEFVHWESPRNIAEDYSVPLRTIYRHAQAFNLFAIRENNLRFSLGRIIERTERMVMTPECVLRAVQLFAKINRRGQWVEPPKQLIVSKGPEITSHPTHDTSTPRRRFIRRPVVARTQSLPFASAAPNSQARSRRKRPKSVSRHRARVTRTNRADAASVARAPAATTAPDTSRQIQPSEPPENLLPAPAFAPEQIIPAPPPNPPIIAPPPQPPPLAQLVPRRADPPFIYDLPGTVRR